MDLGERIIRIALVLFGAMLGAMFGSITIAGDPLVETLGAIGGAFIMYEVLPRKKEE